MNGKLPLRFGGWSTLCHMLFCGIRRGWRDTHSIRPIRHRGRTREGHEGQRSLDVIERRRAVVIAEIAV